LDRGAPFVSVQPPLTLRQAIAKIRFPPPWTATLGWTRKDEVLQKRLRVRLKAGGAWLVDWLSCDVVIGIKPHTSMLAIACRSVVPVALIFAALIALGGKNLAWGSRLASRSIPQSIRLPPPLRSAVSRKERMENETKWNSSLTVTGNIAKACVSEIQTDDGPAARRCFSMSIQARLGRWDGNRLVLVADKRSLDYHDVCTEEWVREGRGQTRWDEAAGAAREQELACSLAKPLGCPGFDVPIPAVLFWRIAGVRCPSSVLARVVCAGISTNAGSPVDAAVPGSMLVVAATDTLACSQAGNDDQWKHFLGLVASAGWKFSTSMNIESEEQEQVVGLWIGE
jgi:hypothetical protein